MKAIVLTQGQVALVDDSDYEALSQARWYAWFSPDTKTFYAARRSGESQVYMARIILGLTDPKQQAEHKNRNTLDNRRENLRVATNSQNQANRRRFKNNTSGFKGVSWRKDRQKWAAYIKSNNHQTHLGFFNTPEEAHAAYTQKAVELHGEFARLA